MLSVLILFSGLYLFCGAAFVVIVLFDEPRQNQGRGLVDCKLVQASPPVILLLAVPRRLFCFGSFVVLDVVFRCLWLFSLYINIKIGKNTFNVRLAGGHLYRKQLFTWLSLVIESVSEGFFYLLKYLIIKQ